MESGKAVMVILQNGDSVLPFKPEKYEACPLDVTGASFDSIDDFIHENCANGILLDVPEMATDAMELCRKLKNESSLEALPIVALLHLPTRSIVTALIDAG